jgi:hypothetical protein
MERGVKVLVRILVGAMLMGSLVIALHPEYRSAFQALLRGDPASSPIWQSNAEYYREVSFEAD